MLNHLATARPGGRPSRCRIALAALIGAFLSLATLCSAQEGSFRYVPGRILVKFRDSAGPMERGRALGSVRARAAHALGNLRIHVVELPNGQNELLTAAALNRRPEVEYAEPDMLVAPAATANDPGYVNQWYLSNIHAPQAWDLTTGSTNVIVAILDTGCDPTNPDLIPNYVAGWNFYNNNNNTSDVMGHGTAVAGCVAAAGNNGIGIASVSWRSKIMPVRISDPTGTGSWSAIANGMQWAADHGARVVNCSYGSLLSSATVASAAQYIVNKGGLFVAPSGNDNVNLGYAVNPNIIVAAGTDSGNNRAGFSNYGPCVTVCAPATGIYTTDLASYGYYSTWEGTSFSSPIVCGVLALEWAANPALSNAQVKSILIQNADDLAGTGWDSSFGYGKVNAYRAVVAAAAATGSGSIPVVSITSPTGGTTVTGTKTVAISATAQLPIARIDLFLDGVIVYSAASSTASVSWDSTKVANGQHTLSAKAYDTANAVGTSNSVTVTVNNVADTTRPVCAITSPSNGSLIGRSVTVNVSASDNVKVVSVTLYLDGGQVASGSAAPYAFTLNTRKWAYGTHTLSAIAKDAAGNASIASTITVSR